MSLRYSSLLLLTVAVVLFLILSSVSAQSTYYYNGTGVSPDDFYNTFIANHTFAATYTNYDTTSDSTPTFSAFSFTTLAAYTCYGKQVSDPTVCSGKGVCSAQDTCSCDFGTYGSQCQNYPAMCFGAAADASNSVVPCSNEGYCKTTDTCSCYKGHDGYNCGFATTCNGIEGDQPDVCSAAGDCVKNPSSDFDSMCVCTAAGWSGTDCDSYYIKCYGINADATPDTCAGCRDPTVCGTHGICNATDTCSCDTGYFGQQCQSSYTCGGVVSYNSNVCNARGKCVGPDVCQCDSYAYGSTCQNTYTCFGINGEMPASCGDYGICVGPDQCTCFGGRFGNQCQNYLTCYGKVYSNFDSENQACSKHGTCVSDGTAPTCSNGVCVQSGTCQCSNPWVGTECSVWDQRCYGIQDTDPSVCSGNGYCYSTDVCLCDDGYDGNQCEQQLVSCFGYYNNSAATCSGRGYCVGTNDCNCLQGSYSVDCSVIRTCNGISSENPYMCSNSAECGSSSTCQCPPGWTGLDCNIGTCYVDPSTVNNLLSNGTSPTLEDTARRGYFRTLGEAMMGCRAWPNLRIVVKSGVTTQETQPLQLLPRWYIQQYQNLRGNFPISNPNFYVIPSGKFYYDSVVIEGEMLSSSVRPTIGGQYANHALRMSHQDLFTAVQGTTSTNLLINGYTIRNLEFIAPASAGDAQALLQGTISVPLKVENCILRSEKATTVPSVRYLLRVTTIERGQLLVRNTIFSGSTYAAIQLTDTNDVTSIDAYSTHYIGDNTVGDNHRGIFLDITGAYKLQINNVTCKVNCGGRNNDFALPYGIVSIRFRQKVSTLSASDMTLATTRLRFFLQNAEIRLDNPTYQTVWPPLVLEYPQMGMRQQAAFWIDGLDTVYESTGYQPTDVSRFSALQLRPGIITSGYDVAMRFTTSRQELFNVLNEPSGWSPLIVDDPRRAMREIQRLNDMNLYGQSTDMRNGTTRADYVPSSASSCTRLCTQSYGGAQSTSNYCQVSREYSLAADTEGYGVYRFSTIQEALALCIYSPMVIQLMHLSADNPMRVARGGQSIHRENIDTDQLRSIAAAGKIVLLQGMFDTNYVDSDVRRRVVLMGHHKIPHLASSQDLSLAMNAEFQMQDLVLHFDDYVSIDPDDQLPLIYSEPGSSSALPMAFRSIGFRGVHFGTYASSNFSSSYFVKPLMDLVNMQTLSEIVMISGNVLSGKGNYADSRTLVQAKYLGDSAANAASLFSIDTMKINGAADAAISVSNVATVKLNGITAEECGFRLTNNSIVNPWCIAAIMLRGSVDATAKQLTITKDASPSTTPRMMSNTTYYTGLWLEFIGMDNTLDNTTAHQRLPKQISGNTISNMPVGLRILPSRFTQTSNLARALSLANPGISNVNFADVVFGSDDAYIMQHLQAEQQRYCTDGCPLADPGLLMYQLILYGGIILGVCSLWLCFCGGVSWCTRSTAQQLKQHHADSASTAALRGLRKAAQRKQVRKLIEQEQLRKQQRGEQYRNLLDMSDLQQRKKK